MQLDYRSYHNSARQACRDGVVDLINGKLVEGWKKYTGRSGLSWYGPRFSDIPFWKGEQIRGKRLLVQYEQGIGEQIFFASVVPDLVADGIHVILEVDDRLVSLFKRSFPSVEVIPYTFPWHEACYTADYVVFAGDAMGFYRPSFAAYPLNTQYLVADAEIVSNLSPIKGKLGLSWASKAQYYADNKTIPVELFKPLLDTRDCISVQYGNIKGPVPAIPKFDITQNMDNMAALLTTCSEVVTISNATAHLAGALGVKTHVLVTNGYGRHFYWYPERQYVPAYPNASAYLQMPAKDWKPLIDYIDKKVLTNPKICV